jgi:succinate dehydrogenase hydrophobic anchor subunit
MASHALQRSDWLLVAASGLALAGFAIAHAAGSAADWLPYPTLTLPTIHPWPIAACLLLFAPVLVWRSRR